MVSLNERFNFMDDINQSPVLIAFNSLLCGQPFTIPLDQSKINEDYFAIVEAIIHREKEQFMGIYRNLSLRVVNKENPSPFVHNDYLIFSLLVGVYIFAVDKSWIKSVVDCRVVSPISTTFNNLVEDNYYSNNSIRVIIYSFLYLTNRTLLTDTLVVSSYDEITLTKVKNNRMDIVGICSFFAYDNIIKSAVINNNTNYNRLLLFEKEFSKRTKVISLIVYNAILLICVWIAYKGLIKYSDIKSEVSDIIMIFGVLGISASNFSNKVRERIDSLFQYILGYRK